MNPSFSSARLETALPFSAHPCFTYTTPTGPFFEFLPSVQPGVELCQWDTWACERRELRKRPTILACSQVAVKLCRTYGRRSSDYNSALYVQRPLADTIALLLSFPQTLLPKTEGGTSVRTLRFLLSPSRKVTTKALVVFCSTESIERGLERRLRCLYPLQLSFPCRLGIDAFFFAPTGKTEDYDEL